MEEEQARGLLKHNGSSNETEAPRRDHPTVVELSPVARTLVTYWSTRFRLVLPLLTFAH